MQFFEERLLMHFAATHYFGRDLFRHFSDFDHALRLLCGSNDYGRRIYEGNIPPEAFWSDISVGLS
jgi:hypothetical protein